MRFIATTSDKVSAIEVKSGQLIFSRDDRIVYLDSDVGRTSFQQIITLVTDEQRNNLVTPVQGFYFVKETGMLWSYDGEWTLVSEEPEDLFFESINDFPAEGKGNKLYVDKGDNRIYHWDTINHNYIEISAQRWEEIS